MTFSDAKPVTALKKLADALLIDLRSCDFDRHRRLSTLCSFKRRCVDGWQLLEIRRHTHSAPGENWVVVSCGIRLDVFAMFYDEDPTPPPVDIGYCHELEPVEPEGALEWRITSEGTADDLARALFRRIVEVALPWFDARASPRRLLDHAVSALDLPTVPRPPFGALRDLAILAKALNRVDLLEAAVAKLEPFKAETAIGVFLKQISRFDPGNNVPGVLPTQRRDRKF